MKAIIKEVTRQNGKVQYDVFYNDTRIECRTIKSANDTADKLNRFNGSLYATHYTNGLGGTACKARQYGTKDLSLVTCPKCLAKASA